MKATRPEPEIVTRKGKPVSVIIPIKDYEELLERVEDPGDVAWLKHARRPPLHYRPLEHYLAERNRDRVLLDRTAEKDLARLAAANWRAAKAMTHSLRRRPR